MRSPGMLVSRLYASYKLALALTLAAVFAGVLVVHGLSYLQAGGGYERIVPTLSEREVRVRLVNLSESFTVPTDNGSALIPAIERGILVSFLLSGKEGSVVQPFVEVSCDPPLGFMAEYSLAEIPSGVSGSAELPVLGGSRVEGPSATLPSDGLYLATIILSPLEERVPRRVVCDYNATLLVTVPEGPITSSWGLIAAFATALLALSLVYSLGVLAPTANSLGWILGSTWAPLTALILAVFYAAIVEPYNTRASAFRIDVVEPGPLYESQYVANIMAVGILEELSPVASRDYMILWVFLALGASILSWLGYESRLDVFEELCVSSRRLLALSRILGPPLLVAGVPTLSYALSLLLSHPGFYAAYPRHTAFMALLNLATLLVLAALINSLSSLLVVALRRGVLSAMLASIAVVLAWTGRIPGVEPLGDLIWLLWRSYMDYLDNLFGFEALEVFTPFSSIHAVKPDYALAVSALVAPLLAYTALFSIYTRRDVG